MTNENINITELLDMRSKLNNSKPQVLEWIREMIDCAKDGMISIDQDHNFLCEVSRDAWYEMTEVCFGDTEDDPEPNYYVWVRRVQHYSNVDEPAFPVYIDELEIDGLLNIAEAIKHSFNRITNK